MGLRSGIRDPGSGKKPIPDPGSRGQKGHRIPDSGSATLTIYFSDINSTMKLLFLGLTDPDPFFCADLSQDPSFDNTIKS